MAAIRAVQYEIQLGLLGIYGGQQIKVCFFTIMADVPMHWLLTDLRIYFRSPAVPAIET